MALQVICDIVRAVVCRGTNDRTLAGHSEWRWACHDRKILFRRVTSTVPGTRSEMLLFSWKMSIYLMDQDSVRGRSFSILGHGSSWCPPIRFFLLFLIVWKFYWNSLDTWGISSVDSSFSKNTTVFFNSQVLPVFMPPGLCPPAPHPPYKPKYRLVWNSPGRAKKRRKTKVSTSLVKRDWMFFLCHYDVCVGKSKLSVSDIFCRTLINKPSFSNGCTECSLRY